MKQDEICRYCGKEIKDGDGVNTFSYWSSVKFRAHSFCKKDGEALEAWECQAIDSSCNTCKYLKRITSRSGVCHKFFSDRFQSKMSFFSNHYQGMGCFVPRKPKPKSV